MCIRDRSIALAKAGVPVYHAGIVGSDGDILLDACKEAGVNTKYIRRLPVKGGHTMIQVDKNAQNCIILYGGTNQMQTREFVDEVLADFGEGDYLLLQNEINMLDYIIDQAYEKKMKIVMNPSPFDEDVYKRQDMIWANIPMFRSSLQKKVLTTSKISRMN